MNLQLPIAGIIYLTALWGIRTVDSWVKSLRKDPVTLVSHGFALVFLTAIGIQVFYFFIKWMLTPFGKFARTYDDTCAVTRTLTLPAMPIHTIYITLLLITILSTWWLSKPTITVTVPF